MIKAVFFDLDGTLLPMDEKEFTNLYFELLANKMEPFGYEKNKLIETIWAGTKAMYKNDGSKTNEQAFWDTFSLMYGSDKLSDKKIFDEFYSNEFKNTIKACKKNDYARKSVLFAKALGLKVILSTNPIFPYVGTKTRMRFNDLNEEMFDFITTYENFNYTKPNPMYFKELLNKFNLLPNEVILFGNNNVEDGKCSRMLGIKCYLVGDNLILDPNEDYEYPKIKMNDIIKVIQEEANN